MSEPLQPIPCDAAPKKPKRSPIAAARGSQPLYKDAPEEAAAPLSAYEPVTQAIVRRRFLALLDRHRETGAGSSWKQALLEPPNPLKPAVRSPLKLPVLYALWILVVSIGGFLWFSFSR